MALNQTPTTIVEDPRKFLHLIYGKAGCGKTSLGAQIPGHYFAICEAGLSGQSAYGSVINNWTDFINLCKDLVAGVQSNWEGQREVTTLVVDVYERLWDYCGEHLCQVETFMVGGRPQKFKKPQEGPFGVVNKRINEVLTLTFDKLRKLGLGIVLLAHEKPRIEKWRGQEITKFYPDLSPGSVTEIIRECDAVGYMTVDEEIRRNDQGQIEKVEQGRYIYWQPGFTWEAKHRYDMPERMLVRKDVGWQDYCELFREAVEKRKQSLTATP